MNPRVRSVLSWWLVQSFGVGVVINLFTVIPYIYFVNRNGNYFFHEDKSPVTAWEYFVQENFRYDMFVTLLFLFLAELNYQYLFKKLNWALFTGSSFAISILCMIVLVVHHPQTLKIWGALSTLRPVTLAATYALGYAIVREYLYQLKYKKDILLQQSESELNSLKAQLNPHFLFNSLNYLYGTALKEEAPQTADGIDKLSEMLRYTVTGMHENFVPVDREISFIGNYVAVQKARLPETDTVSLELNLRGLDPGLQIAPMLLLTFVENAFKHGISTDHPCYVDIKFEGAGERLTMETRNRIMKAPTQITESKTGIKNTLKRLKLLYPQAHTLENTQFNHEYRSILSLKLNKQKNQVTV